MPETSKSAYLPHETVAETRSVDGKEMVLQQHEGAYFLYVDGEMLMGGLHHATEDALGSLGCAPLTGRVAPRVLIGGLGMGYTLRAALDVLPADAAVTVAELCDGVIDWNQDDGPLADLAGRPAEDPRTSVAREDVSALVRNAAPGSYDAILIDTDNETHALSYGGNDALYTDEGLQAAHRALRPGGVLGFWFLTAPGSFDARIEAAGFSVERNVLPCGEGGTHVVLIANRQPPAGRGNGCASRQRREFLEQSTK